jgi:predicted RND superfamily exporter protein
MFDKKSAFWGLGLSMVISLTLLLLKPQLLFDYNFESFFPSDDPELAFYQDFREQFENDNDYLLIALGNPAGIFETDFLEKAFQLQAQLGALDFADNVVSILDMEEPIINPFGLVNRKVLDWTAAQALSTTSAKVLKDPQLRGNLISKDGKYLLLILKNKQLITKDEGDQLYSSVHELLENSGVHPFYSAGKIKAQGEFVDLLQAEFAFFLGISFVLIILILYLIFRTWWGVFVPVIVLASGIGWTIAIMMLVGQPLDVMSVMQPTILLVVGLSAMVHYLTFYLTQLRKGLSKDKAIQVTFSGLFLAIFLTFLTTALGFFSLYATSAVSLKMFGLFTGLGVLLMFMSVVLITPGLLYLLSPLSAVSNDKFTENWRYGLRASLLWTLANRKSVIIGFVLISLGSLFGISQLQINGYLLDNLPRDHELVEEFDFFDHQFGGSKPLEISLAVGENGENLLDPDVLEQIFRLETYLQSKFSTATIISPLTLVKNINKALNGGNINAFALPSPGQMLRITPYVEMALERTDIKFLSEDRKLGRLSSRTSDEGSLKSSVLKKELDDFLDAEINSDLLKVKLTGTSNLIDKSHETITHQMAKGLGIAFILVGVVIGFLFRSWRISLLVLLLNVIPLVWMCGMMWLLGIELKLTTAIVFTVAFGIAVDDSIHFMTKLKSELSKGKSLLYAIKRTYLEAGKGIVLTTLILVSGFSILIFSDFGVTYLAGLLISLALVFALLADLLLLPILLLPMKRVFDSKIHQSSN